MGESKGGFLAKRVSNSAGEAPGTNVGRAARTARREYVPFEDDPTGSAPEGAADAPVSESAKPSMHEVFGPRGFLEKCMVAGFDRSTVSSDYEYRPAQLEMAELVHDAFESHHHAIVEAGTGTGKTLAYLLPAICSGRRVVISTATKSLQEQLYQKDIPFLQKHFAPNLKVAVMKGRANFLCISKLNQLADQGLLKGMEELDAFRQIKDWAKLTETGDRAELTFLPDDSELWGKLDARRDTCTGKNCPSFNPCFVTGMHQRAQEADLIIVNHHLFFADLALKQDDFGSILPEYSAVVFDEAHEMEDVASDYFGRQISNFRFEELARDADQTLRLLHLGTPSLLRKTQRIRERSRGFFELFPPRDGRFSFLRNEREAFVEQNREAYDLLAASLKSMEAEFAALTAKPEELTRIARRSFELRQELSFLLESYERNLVYWYERRNKGVFLTATPIDVSQILRERLFEQFDTVILTSATLTVGGRFDYIRQRLGIDHAKDRALPPEFDYPKQALLYLPRKMPDVRDAGFPGKAADEIVQLLELTHGRAFCLFTSYSQMNDLFERVRSRVSFPMLLQGTAPRSVLLERFKNTKAAVLFATASFWQGVDVPGEQLSCVIVDRLPFAVPSDPIVAARVRALQDDGRNPFAEFQVPQAVLSLKQGFGRLIRAKTDRGVLALLDTRLQRMPYGKIFLESLPRYGMTHELADVARFLDANGASGQLGAKSASPS
ncbi:MAG TPA: ATP-dependent DNA helicase [Candidatus Polarisedimenticolia bacterium]|nr:ATP-dependent DNA helicase [Candidatus Polarisedimenticolia bacterium]